MDPPPYEEPHGAPKDDEQDDDCYTRVSVPPWMIKKILAIGSHDERIRLVKEYLERKGRIVKEKQMALNCQDRTLAQAIKSVKTDVNDLRHAYMSTLWSIAAGKGNRIRTFWKMWIRDFDWYIFAKDSLAAATKDGAQLIHKTEMEKIETAFRKAAKELDEEYKALLVAMLNDDEKMAEAEI